jgi:hypothetical protein
MPLLRGAAPAERQGAIDPLPQAGGLVAHHGEVRDHRQKQEQQAAGQVGVDGEEIPHERRPEVWPDQALARIGKQPEREPRPPEMDDREHRADHQREGGDHLGTARDRTSPAGVDQAQNRGDQRAGVADADPEHEVGDVKAPVDRPLDPREAEAEGHLRDPRHQPRGHDASQDHHERIEAPRRREERTQQVRVHAIGRWMRVVRVCHLSHQESLAR